MDTFSLSTQRFHKVVFALAFLFRFLVFAVAISLVHDTFSLSTAKESCILALLIGQIAGTLSAFSSLRFYVGPALIAGVILLTNGAFLGLQSFFPETRAGILTPYSILLDLNLLFSLLSAGYLSTWCHWRVRLYPTLEVIGALTLLLIFFAPHRDFRFSEAPKIVHLLAWDLNTSPFALLIILSGVATFLTVLALGLSGHAGIPAISRTKRTSLLVSGRPRPFLGTLFVGILVFIISMTSRQVYSHYDVIQESLGANGVGFQEKEESIGKSPLGFHSALGSNSQPAAVVRLGGDYQENPYSPMLYLREGALSAFNGTELVNAGKSFDSDIPATAPTERYRGGEEVELLERVPVPQSIYLITDHDVAFAVDYPISLEPLENPSPERFRSAYRAYSMAPSYSLHALESRQVGNSEWTKEVQQHYLVPHTDKRYGAMATELTEDESNPARQAFLLTQFLNKRSIYTLSPNHDVGKDEDPVAPFLFGDMRGYCVHFAHATVYMLRALGIPARIATGYLTDMSQARDGHILLRMSDRHAWAEAYFSGIGWVVFDTQPENVESHADTEVDSELLEELMGLIGEEKTFLPEEEFHDEPGLQEPDPYELPSSAALLKVFALCLGVAFLWKLFLWYGWLLPSSHRTQIRRGYRAIATRLADLGYERNYAETGRELLQRFRESEQVSPDRIWQRWKEVKYGGESPSPVAPITAIRRDLEQLQQISLLRRALSFLHPLSLIRTITGGGS
ncbi:transglutaminase-like domain-containing protein [bacterium]|nr:transglutaminase-like domain-containing protein [bacterium]